MPEKLGKYHLLERVAEGGMAEIYKAKTVGIAGFEKILAVKRIRPSLARQQRFIRNFIDEARIAVSLNHRNIVQVFDFGKSEGSLYLAMELIEGVDLRAAIRLAAKSGKRLPLAIACYILADVGAGLDYAHRKKDAAGRSLGIVHCDVSPQNIMLSFEGFVKILDFGVARARFSLPPTEKRLRGKPRYMAPEQTRGEVPTPRVDVFALGILAWELAANRRLFTGRNVQQILTAVRAAEVPDLRSINPEVPESLSRAIARALSAAPDDRGTAAELAAELAKAARELAEAPSSRALAEWLIPLAAGGDPTETTTLGRFANADAAHLPELILDEAERLASEFQADTEDSPQEPSIPEMVEPTAKIATDPGVEALLDRRRVLASAVLLDGGNAESRREIARMLADLAYKRGAVVHSQSESQVVAVFGLEVAGEDNVAAAMRYALDAVELARDAGASPSSSGSAISVRVAARAGIMASRGPQGFRLQADAVDEAIALAQNASPGRPLLTGGTGRMASAQFSFRELPARQYRSRRLRVLELLGPSDYNERVRVLHDRSGRFVGREKELESLGELLERSREESSRLAVVISGSAGVGKSRLVAEFVAAATEGADDGSAVAVAAMLGTRDIPFTLVTELVQASLNLPPERGEAARARFSQRMRSALEACSTPESTIGEIEDAFEMAMEVRDGALAGPTDPSADLRERVASALRSYREAVVDRKAAIIAVENLQLADQVSLDVLTRYLSAPSAGSELVLLTMRGDPTTTLGPDSVAQHIELGELPVEDSLTLIRQRVAPGTDEETILALERRAGGNPLFIEALAEAGGELAADSTLASARDVMLARVDQLPRAAKAVLQHAAVIGMQFRARILEELVGPSVHKHLQILAEEGLIARRDDASVEADEGVLSFRHGLLQEVVYNSLAVGPRRSTHAALGRILALRSEAGRDEPPALVARHLELGGKPEEAGRFWVRAGKLEHAARDPAGARESFTRALKLLPASATEVRREALFGREQAYRDLGAHDNQRADLDELEKLVGNDEASRIELDSRRAIHLLRTGNFARAIELANAAQIMATKAGDDRARGEALRVLGEAYERTGEFQRGLDVVQEAIALFHSMGASNAEMRARMDLGRNLLVRNRYSDARATYEPLLARFEKEPNPWLERIARNHCAVIHLCLGEFEDAMRSAERSLEICEYYGDAARMGDNLSVCGLILNEVGQFKKAEEQFRRALEIHEQTRSQWSRADCLVYAATNRAQLGDHDRAIRELGEALGQARALGSPYIEANAGCALAAVYLMRGGEGDLERAMDAAGAAADVANSATLHGARALALARQAEAARRRGAQTAIELASQAVDLLDRQEHIEGSEEEVLWIAYRAHEERGSTDAAGYHERAADHVRRKLGLLKDPTWRGSYQQLPIVSAILNTGDTP